MGFHHFERERKAPFFSVFGCGAVGRAGLRTLTHTSPLRYFSVRRPAFFAAEGLSRRLPLMMAFGPHFRFE